MTARHEPLDAVAVRLAPPAERTGHRPHRTPQSTTFSLTNPTGYVLVMFVTDADTLPAAYRCLLMIEALIECVVTGLYSGISGPMVIRIWKRLTLITRGLSIAVSRPIRLAPIDRQPPACQHRSRPSTSEQPFNPYRLPTSHAWLVKLIPETQACADQLQAVLSEPEMVALLQTRPGLNRLLRPLCRMLGIQPPSAPLADPPGGNLPPHPLPARTQPAAAPAPAVPWDQPPLNPAGRSSRPAVPPPNPTSGQA